MSEINNGGPAFPSPPPTINTSTAEDEYWQPGMSLRDWFAGQAVAGICAGAFGTDEGAERLAAVCLSKGLGASEALAILAYENADAMLRKREGDK